MVSNIKCLCAECKRQCGMDARRELAMGRKLTFVYLNNGEKLTNTCSMFTESTANERPFAVPVFLGREGMLKII